MSKCHKRFFDLTNAEIAERKKLTNDEAIAVSRVVEAVKALPKSICLSVENKFYGKPGLRISKRITAAGSCCQVAYIRKASLHF